MFFFHNLLTAVISDKRALTSVIMVFPLGEHNGLSMAVVCKCWGTLYRNSEPYHN